MFRPARAILSLKNNFKKHTKTDIHDFNKLLRSKYTTMNKTLYTLESYNTFRAETCSALDT
jgi:hypothetical protein